MREILFHFLNTTAACYQRGGRTAGEPIHPHHNPVCSGGFGEDRCRSWSRAVRPCSILPWLPDQDTVVHVCRSQPRAVQYPVLPAPPSRTHVVVPHRPGALRDLAGTDPV